MKIQLQPITAQNFAPYGRVLEFTPEADERFHVVITEEKEPWRLAVFRYRNHEIDTMEAHPTTLESFEPLSGITVLLVAAPETPDQPEAFVLDKPVCLYKGVWHQAMALTAEAQCKIAENLEVPGTVFHRFAHPLGVYLTE